MGRRTPEQSRRRLELDIIALALNAPVNRRLSNSFLVQRSTLIANSNVCRTLLKITPQSTCSGFLKHQDRFQNSSRAIVLMLKSLQVQLPATLIQGIPNR